MTPLRMAAVIALTGLLLLCLGPAASAQDLPGTGAVEGVAGTGSDTVNGTAGTATDAVNDATETAENTAGDATETVNQTTGSATQTVDDTVNDTAGNVQNTVGNVHETVDDTTDTVDEATAGTTKDVTDKIDEATDPPPSGSKKPGDLIDDLVGGTLDPDSPHVSNLGHLTPDLVDDLVKEAAGLGLTPVAAEGWIDGDGVVGSAAYEDPHVMLGSLSTLMEELALAVASGGPSGGDITFSTTTDDPSILGSAGRAAISAAKALAFPLALALIVVGFLSVQGRIGRKDPKLALAPVDITEESLSFE